MVLSGPPGPVIFTWRHWAEFTGTFRGRQGNGELIELYGLCRVIVNEELKIQKIEVSYQHHISTRKCVTLWHKCRMKLIFPLPPNGQTCEHIILYFI